MTGTSNFEWITGIKIKLFYLYKNTVLTVSEKKETQQGINTTLKYLKVQKLTKLN
ncbi:MAG: hypothetical protein ACI92O_002416 [Colwellia sp.]|jgi:hypothetical protein|tara:strand:- start:2123 stop:2287 length:165 start_codon:yes stop_codon:yes gene_type:complete